jgi:PEP-CTERM motif
MDHATICCRPAMKYFFISVMFAASLIVSLLPADGWALSFVATRGALGANDFVDWSVLGTDVSDVINPFLTSSDVGLGITGSLPAGDFLRVDEGSTWSGNFAPGDALLFTGFNPGPISLAFGSPIFGAGAQIQNNIYGEFRGIISAFDSSNALLGSFQLDGNSNGSGDNSAIFLGVRDTTARIRRIEFDIIPGEKGGSDFAINRLDIVTSTNQVPEPTSLLLLGAGLAGIGIRRQQTARKE